MSLESYKGCKYTVLLRTAPTCTFFSEIAGIRITITFSIFSMNSNANSVQPGIGARVVFTADFDLTVPASEHEARVVFTDPKFPRCRVVWRCHRQTKQSAWSLVEVGMRVLIEHNSNVSGAGGDFNNKLDKGKVTGNKLIYTYTYQYSTHTNIYIE